jgi:predicted DNA-binding transcriptional regulator AlpA
MPKVDFKAYTRVKEKNALPSQLDIIISKYGLYLKASQVAECLGIKRDLIYGLLSIGSIKSKRIGGPNGTIRISAVELAKYMDGCDMR